MSTKLIEQEITELKERVARLEKAAATTGEKAAPTATIRPKAKDTWRNIVGSVTDSETHRSAMRLGEEWRARMNAEGR